MNSINRRAFLGGATAALASGPRALAEVDDRQRNTPRHFKIERDGGRAFIIGLIDPELGLAPEFAGHNVYWLFHDNYLAAKILNRSHPETAAGIRAAIASFGVERSGKIEILFDEAPNALPFKHYELTDVKQVGSKLIRTEITQPGEMKGWEEYADLRFLAAIARAKSDPARAAEDADAAWAMWDGVGFRDLVVEVHHRYATYKLALGLIAASRLGRIPKEWALTRAGAPPAYAQALDRMLAQRNAQGGWITDYKPDGTPVGLANVETTSMAVLALDEMASYGGHSKR